MPDDKQLKRVSNLLNSLQVRTALESTNVNPQYLSQETARRDAKKLEEAGNRIDPVTKKPYKYSDNWYMSTGQQVPGLDSEGQSAMDALNLIGTGQLVGQLGKAAINITKNAPLKTAGRIITNIIEPVGYDNKIGNLINTIKQRPLDVVKSIVLDKPMYNPSVLQGRYAAYRNLFKLKPSATVLEEQPFLKDAFIKKTINGRDALIPNVKNPIGKDFIQTTKVGQQYNSTMGNFTNKFIKVGNKDYQFFGDNWDFALNPDEYPAIKNAYMNKNIDIDKKILPQLIKNQFSRDPQSMGLLQFLSRGTNQDLTTDLLRIIVDKKVNPTSFAGLRPVNSQTVSKINTLKYKKNQLIDRNIAGEIGNIEYMSKYNALDKLIEYTMKNPIELSYGSKTANIVRQMEKTANNIANNIRKLREFGEEPTEKQLAALYKLDSRISAIKSKAMYSLDKQPLAPFDWILDKHLPK